MQRRVFFNGNYYCVQTMEGLLRLKHRWWHDVNVKPNFTAAELAFTYKYRLNKRQDYNWTDYQMKI
ncbi:hypothetical protein [Aeromonas phage 4L372D]|uniref:Uncharacterized protein n=2 Tax=Plateaulakevirus TaxID=2843436 RepID=A0A5B9NAX1_9CAUD|nr:hypothetical protein HWC25_gp073 [Aeromonas phage 2L372D]YP_009846645.1 hypothetical protein HWC27_gp097 [Aeromonas phage 4L372D]QDB73987.1 hypothetical protein 2L372D_073 [Aeromonas phage 2L372D]QEG08561.1 hypothetical protein [Aeromonas phage 4L372D]